MSLKAIVAIVSGLLAVSAGVYLSGWMILALLGLESVPLQWNTWWTYYQAMDLPQVAPYVTKIKLAGATGLGLPLAAWLLLLVLMFKPRERAFHGDAEFATAGHLAKRGFLTHKPEESIFLGMLSSRPIWLNGTLHAIVTAPTRSGKSTCIAIPILLTYEGSVVVLDVKGELYRITSGYRGLALGQSVYIWSPYDETGRTHRFNPFTPLARLAPGIRWGELQTIAAILYPDAPGKDPFWVSQARAAFVAFAAFMFERWDALVQASHAGNNSTLDPNADPRFPSFERIYRMTSGEGRQGGIKQVIDDVLSQANQQHFAHVSDRTRTAFAGLANLAEETFSSVIATVQAPLQPFLSPILAAATNATDFDVLELRRRKMSVYVVIPPQKLDEASKLLNIFFSSAIGGNLRQDKTTDPTIKHQVLMLMDEFTSMGRLDVWAKNISVSASYGVRSVAIVQSHSQLRAVYGADEAQTFSTNHAAHIVFTPREQEDAEAYSRTLGDCTVRRRHRTVSGGHASYSYTEERRPLMLPQEIKELPKDDELIFLEGCKPIRAKKKWYFKDRQLKKRLLEPMPLPQPSHGKP